MSKSWTYRLSIELLRLAGLRHVVTVLGFAILLGACEGGSGQSGSAFVFLTVNGFSLTAGGGSTATVNSSIDTGTTTTACVTLQNNRKNPTITGSNALDNVIVQSYTVTLASASGGGLPGPFTFGTSVLVPAETTTSGMNPVTTPGTATFPVILVPAGAKLDPRVRPPNQLPILATAEVTFRGRDGRGNSVETEGAVTVMFISGGEDSQTNCAGTAGSGNGATG